MENIYVVYFSNTGNTEIMAKAVADGIKEAGKEPKLLEVTEISSSILKEESVFALGCPACGAEELEDGHMEPLVTELEGFVSGKKVLLFGSYGWGDGEWMHTWEDRMKKAGAELVNGEGIIILETPDSETEVKCKKAGKELASLK